MLFVSGAFFWDMILWLALGYLILKRKIDFFYLSFLAGLIFTVFFVIAEARYKMQIMPALVVGAFSSLPFAARGQRLNH